MSLMCEDSQNYEESRELVASPSFEAKISNVRYVTQLLKAIHFKEYATIFLNSNGIKVTVEEAKSVQANSFLQIDLFEYYNLREDTISFKINFNTLMDCLGIFGHSNPSEVHTPLKIIYEGYGSPLSLFVQESTVYTECSIKTFDPDEIAFFDFLSANVVNKIIMRSDYLKDTFAELDTSSEYLEICISPAVPNFRLSTISAFCSFHLECPKESEVMEHFECTKEQKHKYNTVLMKPSTKALAPSIKVSIRTDDSGLLCMQFLIIVDGENECFVEYYCLPNVDAD